MIFNPAENVNYRALCISAPVSLCYRDNNTQRCKVVWRVWEQKYKRKNTEYYELLPKLVCYRDNGTQRCKAVVLDIMAFKILAAKIQKNTEHYVFLLQLVSAIEIIVHRDAK